MPGWGGPERLEEEAGPSAPASLAGWSEPRAPPGGGHGVRVTVPEGQDGKPGPLGGSPAETPRTRPHIPFRGKEQTQEAPASPGVVPQGLEPPPAPASQGAVPQGAPRWGGRLGSVIRRMPTRAGTKGRWNPAPECYYKPVPDDSLLN